jgi:hypothetical protein
MVVTEKLVGGGCTEENEMNTKKFLVTCCKSALTAHAAGEKHKK